MKLLPPRLIDFSKANLISSSNSPRQLYRLGGIHFLIKCRNNTKPVIAIESVDMDAVITDLNSEIIDIELSTIRPLITREPERSGCQEIEVRMYSKRGDVYVIRTHYGILIL